MRKVLPWLRDDDMEQLQWAMGYLNDRAHTLGPLGAGAGGVLIGPSGGYTIYGRIMQWANQADGDPKHKKLRARMGRAWAGRKCSAKKKMKTRSLALQESTKADLDRFARDRYMTIDAAIHALLLGGLKQTAELDKLLQDKVREIEAYRKKQFGQSDQQSQSIGSLKSILQEVAIDLAACQLQLEHATARGYELTSLPTERVLKASTRILKEAQEQDKERLGSKHPAIRLLGTLTEELVKKRLRQQADRKPLPKMRRRAHNLLNQAELRIPDAHLGELHRDGRGINLGQLDALAPCTWLQHSQQVVITGAPGTGKTWLACALGHQACLKGFRTRYYNQRTLLQELAEEAKGRRIGALRTKLLQQELLILDEFDPQGLSDQQYLWLLEIIDDREGRRSTLVTSLKSPQEWLERVPDNQYAHMLIDRLKVARCIINLSGPSMRTHSEQSDESPPASTNQSTESDNGQTELPEFLEEPPAEPAGPIENAKDSAMADPLDTPGESAAEEATIDPFLKNYERSLRGEL